MYSNDKDVNKESLLFLADDEDIASLPTFVPHVISVVDEAISEKQAACWLPSITATSQATSGFEQEKTQNYSAGSAFTSADGLVIYSENGNFGIIEYNWFGYNAKVLSLSEKKIFKINIAESSFKVFSFDYFALHNTTTKVCFYDGAGNLIATLPLEYTGSPNKNNLNIKTLNFTAPAGKTIGQVVIEVGDEPGVGDSGFIVSNLRWSGTDVLDVTPALQMMEKDTGTSASDLITNDGSAGRTVRGTLSRPLSANEQLEFWNGSKWVLADVNLQRWTAVDDSVHGSSWQYKLRVVHAEHGAGKAFSFDITLDTSPSSGKVVFGAMTEDDGSSASDWITSEGKAGRKVSGQIAGTLESGDLVQYSLNEGKTWLTLNVQSDLTWSFIDPSAHSQDWHYLIRIVDIAGNATTPVRQDVEFVLLQPDIISIHDNVGVKGFLTSPGFTDDTTPTLKGTAQPGTTLFIYNGSQLLGRCITDGAGNWQWTPQAALANGHYDFHVVTSTGGKTSAPSNHWPVTIAGAPQITALYDDTGAQQGTIANGYATDDATPTLQGTAVAGSLVTFYEGSKMVGSTLANGQGEWTWSVVDHYPDGLGLGMHTFTARTPIGDGSDAISTSWSVKIISPTPHPSINILSMSLDSGMYADDFITNNGSAGRTLNGSLSRKLIGSETLEVWNGSNWLPATINGKNWSVIDPVAHTSSWQYKVRVAVGDGTYSPEVNRDVVLDKTATIPLITHAWDDVGNTGKIVAGGKTNDIRPELFGTAEPGITVEIEYGKAYAPWRKGGTVTVNAEGSWKWTPPLDLTNSVWEFRAKATDTAGNVSSWTKKFTFTVDTSIDQYGVPDVEHFSSSLQSILTWHEGAALPQKEYSLDQLILTGEHQTISLDNLPFLKSVNTIDITGEGDNQFTLTADDVLQKGDEFIFIANNTSQLQINGDEGDVVNLSHLLNDNALEGWHKSVGVVTSGGKDYSVWTNDFADIEVLIQTEVQVNI